MTDSSDKPKRRVRYRGKYPRVFHEKYKELHPERYPDEIEHVLASGKTPAGAHRPICVKEVLDVLKPRPGEIAVDCTVGYGGHARELLRAVSPGGRLYGLDVDSIELPKTEARLRSQTPTADALVLRRMNFAGLPKLLAEEGLNGADVVLADLGVSSMQLDDPSRGFTYKHDGPLDLRMNPQRGRPASALLATLDEEPLATLLEANADEPHADLIAKALVERRGRLSTTKALAEAVREALAPLPGRVRSELGDASIRRTFQALRIAVNDEFSALDSLLRVLPSCLNPGGRVAILTFHSGEDRRVKKAFREGLRESDYCRIADDVIRPTRDEVYSNPRASSARLRWAVRA